MLLIAWVVFDVSLIAIMWIYLGYALFIRIYSKFFGHSHVTNESFTPRITFIIPTYNEEKVIKNKIENTLSLDYPKEQLDIVIIDDASTDETVRIVQTFDKKLVSIFTKPTRSGKANSVNIGVSKTTSDYVVVSDADVSINRESLRMMMRHFIDPKVGAVSGLNEVEPIHQAGMAASVYWQYENSMLISESLIDSRTYIMGSLFAVDRAVLESMPLDSSNVTEDFDLTIQIRKSGKRILTEDLARITKIEPVISRHIIIQRSRTANGTIQTLWKHRRCLYNPRYGFFGMIALPSHKLGQVISPIIFTLCIASAIFLSFSASRMILFATSSLTLIGLVGYMLIGHTLNPRILIRALAYIILLQWTMTLGWWKFFKGDSQVTWQQVRI